VAGGRAQSWGRCGQGASSVLRQMWAGGELSPGADVERAFKAWSAVVREHAVQRVRNIDAADSRPARHGVMTRYASTPCNGQQLALQRPTTSIATAT
jgi:hypothetical protein